MEKRPMKTFAAAIAPLLAGIALAAHTDHGSGYNIDDPIGTGGPDDVLGDPNTGNVDTTKFDADKADTEGDSLGGMATKSIDDVNDAGAGDSATSGSDASTTATIQT